MHIKPTIRRAVRDDLAGVLALYRHLHSNDPDIDPFAAEQVWSEILSGSTTLIVADRAGLLAASCTLAVIPNLSRGARSYDVPDLTP